MRVLPPALLVAILVTPAPAAGLDWRTMLFPASQHATRHHARATTAKPAPPAVPVPLADPRPAGPGAASTMPLPRKRPDEPPNSAPTAAPSPAVPMPAGAPADKVIAPAEKMEAPTRLYQTACPAVIAGEVTARPLPPIADGQCQALSPLSVTAILVNGRSVPLSAPAIFDCQMATDLPGWVAQVDTYIRATLRTEITSVLVGGSYECRPRRTPDGSAGLSEHGRADALDFVGFTLADGRPLTVTADYNAPDARLTRLMHFAHDAACTRFTTVLGPDANALHHDHFHLDLGCHGEACTYRLCE